MFFFLFSSICSPDWNPPAPIFTHHRLSTLCFFFESSTLGSWLCCFQCRLSTKSSSHHKTIKLTYLGICFSIQEDVTSFLHAFRFMRAVSKRWRICLSPSRTRRALRRRSNSVYQGLFKVFSKSFLNQRYS